MSYGNDSYGSGQRHGDELGDDYQTVPERIRLFRDKHPEGSLRPADPAFPFRIITLGQATYVVVTAAAYRAPDDPAPGVGQAWQEIPARDDVIRGSELMAAETAAFGRAIVASLAADTRRMATAEEVQRAQAMRAPQAPQAAPPPAPPAPPAAPPQVAPQAPQAAPGAPVVPEQPTLDAPPSQVVQQALTSAPPVTQHGIAPAAAPMTHDAREEEGNRVVIANTLDLLRDPTTTADDIRDLWQVLNQARLLAWRVPPMDGVEPDGDGLVPIGTLVAAVGRARTPVLT